MKIFHKILVLVCALLLCKPVINADTTECIKGVCKKVFKDNACSYEDKLCCVNEALENKQLLVQDQDLLTCLQIILHTFITPKTPIDPNVILYRTPKETILHWAAKFDEVNLIQMLIAEGAQINPINQWKETPLHYTAQWNSPKAAQILMNSGADPSVRDQYKKTALDYAKDYNHQEVLAVLIKQREKTTKASK